MKKRVIVADDSIECREYLCHILDKIGFETFPVENGHLALTVFKINGADLLITDMVKPIFRDQFEKCVQSFFGGRFMALKKSP